MAKKRSIELYPPAKSYRMSREAIVALEALTAALDLTKGKALELAVLRLHEEWRAGRIKGVSLQVSS